MFTAEWLEALSASAGSTIPATPYHHHGIQAFHSKLVWRTVRKGYLELAHAPSNYLIHKAPRYSLDSIRGTWETCQYQRLVVWFILCTHLTMLKSQNCPPCIISRSTFPGLHPTLLPLLVKEATSLTSQDSLHLFINCIVNGCSTLPLATRFGLFRHSSPIAFPLFFIFQLLTDTLSSNNRGNHMKFELLDHDRNSTNSHIYGRDQTYQPLKSPPVIIILIAFSTGTDILDSHRLSQ